MLPYTQTKGQVLSSTVPAHRICQTPFVFFTFWDAALHPDKGTSALKYCARAQNVSSVTTILSFLDAGSHHDEGSSTLKHRACAQKFHMHGSDITLTGVHNYNTRRGGEGPKIREEIRTCCSTDRQKVRQKVRRRSWMPKLAKEGFETNRAKIPRGARI